MEFKKAVVTNQGKGLLAKLLTGNKTMSFTKIVTSTKVYFDSQLEALTTLLDAKQTTAASAYKIDNSTVSIVGTFENEGLTEGYYINTVGLYAQDPDIGEILFSVSIAEKNGYMPPDVGLSKSGFTFKMSTAVSNTDKVTVVVDPAASVTVGDLDVFRAEFYDKKQTHALLRDLLMGKPLEFTMECDLAGKVAGSVVENPHKAFVASYPVNNMQEFFAREIGQIEYNRMNERLASVVMQTSTKGKSASFSLKWEIILDIEKHFPELFPFLSATTLLEKIAVVNKLIKKATHVIEANAKVKNVWGLASYPTKGDNIDAFAAKAKVGSGYDPLILEVNTPVLYSDGTLGLVSFGSPATAEDSSFMYVKSASFSYTLQFKFDDFFASKTQYDADISAIKTWIQQQGGTI